MTVFTVTLPDKIWMNVVQFSIKNTHTIAKTVAEGPVGMIPTGASAFGRAILGESLETNDCRLQDS